MATRPRICCYRTMSRRSAKVTCWRLRMMRATRAIVFIDQRSVTGNDIATLRCSHLRYSKHSSASVAKCLYCREESAIEGRDLKELVDRETRDVHRITWRINSTGKQ